MWHRVEQFGASLWPRVTPQELDQVAGWLPPAGIVLFRSMTRRDQRHSLDVVGVLRAAGHQQPDLLAAALLHDAAKTALPGRRLTLGHRVAVVLMQAAKPGWVERVARADPGDWRYPFYLHLHHPEMGAQLAEEAGCSLRTVQLIRRHQQPSSASAGEHDQWLAWLQAADDTS
jgi:hypothetical protein